MSLVHHRHRALGAPLILLLSFAGADVLRAQSLDKRFAAIESLRQEGSLESSTLALGEIWIDHPDHPRVQRQLDALPRRSKPYDLVLRDDPPRHIVFDSKRSIIWSRIPSGEFLLGSQTDDSQPEEKPTRSVQISAFWIDVYEVRCSRYATYVRENGQTPPSYWPGREPPKGWDQLPVTHVTWDDADQFARSLGARLPTEIEWERAAEFAHQGSFPWGDSRGDGTKANLNRFRAGAPRPVSSHLPGRSPTLVFNLTGNVWEWCADSFVPYRYDDMQEGILDPPPPRSNDLKCIRGGSFLDGWELGRTSFRGFAHRTFKSGSHGIRLVLDGDAFD